MGLIANLACLLALMATGCRYAGPYVTERTEVRIEWIAEPSTAIYQGLAVPGQYRLNRYQGRSILTSPGVGRWGLAERQEGPSSRRIAQPLSTEQVELRASGSEIELVVGDGNSYELELVRGTWADYQAGHEVVLAFSEASWNVWTAASHDAFLDLVDGERRRLLMTIERECRFTDAQEPDILVDEKPLIRADHRRLMIFFEQIEIRSHFEVIERRRDAAHVWWVGEYELTPSARHFFASAGVVTAQVAFHVGHAMLHCARAAGRCR